MIRRPRLTTARLALALLLITSTTSTGCYGHFKLVNAVRDFNEGVGPNRVLRSLIMWGMVIIPIYEVAWLGDVLIFNVVEFFNAGPTGTVAGAVEKRRTLPDGTEVQVARVAPDTVRIRRTDAAGRQETVDIVKVGEHAGYVRRADGAGTRIVASVEELPDGRLIETPTTLGAPSP
jgi:hypothetical protein